MLSEIEKIAQSKDSWIDKRPEIIKLLNELEPDKPTDNTCGFIAYNVPDKPRMKMKTGRFLTRKLKLNSGFLSDSEIQSIAEQINLKLFPDVQVRLDKGSQITKNYENDVGGCSCMTGDDCDCTKLYEMNPDRFQQLIMMYNDNSARAIVSKLDNGRYLMDRIYSDSETLKDKMFDYAEKQGWIYRTYTKSDKFDVSNGNSSECIVSGLEYEDGYIPYMDTLFKYCIENNRLTIFHKDVNKNSHGELDNTDGYLQASMYCDICDNRINEDNCFYVDDGVCCEGCYSENFFHCEYCEQDVSVDEQTFIEDKHIYVCRYCAEHHYSKCKECGNYFYSVYTVDNDEQCCENCLDNYSKCEECGEYFSTLNKENLCEDCAENEISKNLPISIKSEDTITGRLF